MRGRSSAIGRFRKLGKMGGSVGGVSVSGFRAGKAGESGGSSWAITVAVKHDKVMLKAFRVMICVSFDNLRDSLKTVQNSRDLL